MLELYGYFRSSATMRVRIGLRLKNLAFEEIPVHLLHHGGEQFLPGYSNMNPQSLVPTLKHNGTIITQSLAILEYLNEVFPKVPLLPHSPEHKAWVRSLALTIATDIHPLNNLRVLKYLTGKLGNSEDDKIKWIQHWIKLGFSALETRIARNPHRGRFCYGNEPGLADICLIPQMYNAKRFHLDLTPYPTLLAIEEECLELEAFSESLPA